MKKLFTIFVLLAIFGLSTNAQQCISGGCSNLTNQYPTGTLTPTTSWATKTGMNAGNWTLFSVTSGNTYEWTYCEAYGGVSTAWDAQLTLYNNTNLSSPICFSTDQCGANSNAPYISWVASFSGTVRILTSKYSAGVGCQSNSGSPYNTLAYRMIASTCTGVTSVTTQPQSQSICAGTSVTLTVATNGTPPFTYFWCNGGGPISGAPNSPSYTTSTPGNYYCEIENCPPNWSQIISSTATLTVTASPITPIISGNTAICSGQPTTLTITNPCSGCTYTWSNGGSGTSISVSTAGTYTATAHNSCGDAGPSTPLNVTVNPAPVTPVIAAQGGVTSFCQGGSATLQVSNTSSCPGCTYTWYPSGSGSSINVTSAGTYYCTSSNTCPGTSPQSNSIPITVSPAPTTPVISAQGGTTSFCQGTGSATLQVSNPCTGCTYTWYPSGSGTSINITNAGTYSCTSSNTCGGPSSQSNTIQITVNTTPVTSFTYNGGGCNWSFTDNSSGSPSSWNWNFGDPASGANNTSILQSPQHLFSSAGTYNVSLQATNLCGSNSANQYIIATGIGEYNLPNVENIAISPNPVSNSALINFTIIKKIKVSINLYNILGEKVSSISETEYSPGDYSITLNKTEKIIAGTYFIKFDVDNSSEKIKVIFY